MKTLLRILGLIIILTTIAVAIAVGVFLLAQPRAETLQRDRNVADLSCRSDRVLS
jgi:Na+/H+-dicarboxylate symporter